MTHRIILPAAALALSGCGLLGPPSTGHVEGRVNVCVSYGDGVEPICQSASANVQITLEGAGPTETATLDSEVFRFTDVEVGSYTLFAAYTGDRCLVVFEQTAVTVTEDETANVVIEGRGRC